MKVVYKSERISVKDIYTYLDKGIEVYWGSLFYIVIKEKTEHNEYTDFSKNGSYCLMIYCKMNGSKTLLNNQQSLNDCFIVNLK